MSSAPNQLSFLPDDYLELKAQRRTNAICAGLFAVVVGMVGVTFKFGFAHCGVLKRFVVVSSTRRILPQGTGPARHPRIVRTPSLSRSPNDA